MAGLPWLIRPMRASLRHGLPEDGGVSVVLGKFPTDTPDLASEFRLTAPAPGLLLRLTTVPDHALAQVSHIRWFFG